MNKTSLRLLSSLLVSAILSTLADAAVVSDNFSDGYPTGGTGWSEGWSYRHYRTTSPASRAEVRDTAPLSGGDDYLSVRFERNVSSSGDYSIVSRPFDTTVVDNTKLHEIKFDIRLDYSTHWTVASDQIAIFASSGKLSEKGAVSSLTNSWGLTYDGANGWLIMEGNGAGAAQSVAPASYFGGAADGNTVYSITLKVDPTSNTFQVSITDGTRTESWGDNNFRFLNPDTNGAGQHLHFYAQARNGVQIEYSLDNLTVASIPEPSTVALASICFAGFGLKMIGKKRLLLAFGKE